MLFCHAEKSELGSCRFIRDSRACIIVVLLDALSVVTQPIFKKKLAGQIIIREDGHYLFYKPHPSNDIKKDLS